jgi:hypothetical protein
VNLIFLPEKYQISIIDDGADTCVLGRGWEFLSVQNTRKANIVDFDHEATMKRNLPVVNAITAIDLLDGLSVSLIVHEGIHSLLSEFQLRDFGVKIDSIYHKHGATQKTVIQDDVDLIFIIYYSFFRVLCYS